MIRFLLALVILFVVVGDSFAGPFQRFRDRRSGTSCGTAATTSSCGSASVTLSGCGPAGCPLSAPGQTKTVVQGYVTFVDTYGNVWVLAKPPAVVPVPVPPVAK